MFIGAVILPLRLTVEALERLERRESSVRRKSLHSGKESAFQASSSAKRLELQRVCTIGWCYVLDRPRVRKCATRHASHRASHRHSCPCRCARAHASMRVSTHAKYVMRQSREKTKTPVVCAQMHAHAHRACRTAPKPQCPPHGLRRTGRGQSRCSLAVRENDHWVKRDPPHRTLFLTPCSVGVEAIASTQSTPSTPSTAARQPSTVSPSTVTQ